MASMAGDAIAEEMTTFYMQNWADVGLNVILSTGRLIEFNSSMIKYKRMIQKLISLWLHGVQVLTHLQQDYTGKESAFNFSRYTTPKIRRDY